MKNTTSTSGGFSTVELLITLIVAAMFLLSGYTLYSTIAVRSADSRHRAQADNIAYDYLRRYESTVTNPCVASTPVSAAPLNGGVADGLGGATVTVSVTCPNASVLSVSLVTVTIGYLEGGVQKNVYHEIYSSAQ